MSVLNLDPVDWYNHSKVGDLVTLNFPTKRLFSKAVKKISIYLHVRGALMLDVLLAPPGGCGVLSGKDGGGILNGGVGGAAIWA